MFLPTRNTILYVVLQEAWNSMPVPVSGVRFTRMDFSQRTALDREGKAPRLGPTHDLRTDFGPWLMSTRSVLRYSDRFMATRSTTSFGPMRSHLAFSPATFPHTVSTCLASAVSQSFPKVL